MARSGTEGYIEDLLIATSKLRSVLGQQLTVAPLPHLFTAGCTCPLTIRTAAEVTVWASRVFGEEGKFLTSSFKIANFLLNPKRGEEVQQDYEKLVRLPTSTTWPSAKVAWVMSGFDLPIQIQPTGEMAEKEIILSIINELRTGLAVDLDPAPTFDRMVPVDGGGQAGPPTEYLILGRAKAVAMVATALTKAGKRCEQLSQPEWRITQAYVAKMASDLEAEMAKHRPRVIVVVGLDESYFMAQFEEVHTTPARRDADGHYHIDGELVVATKEVQLRMLKTMRPIWEATSGHKTIVVGPMVRYLTESCCDDEDHLPNRNDAGFGEGLRKKMLEARNVLKDFLTKEGHGHCRVLDPAVDIAGKQMADIWNVGDPTHPREEIYDSMVAAFVKAENRIDLTAKRPGEKLSGPATKKQRTAEPTVPPPQQQQLGEDGGNGGGGGGQGRGRGGRGGGRSKARGRGSGRRGSSRPGGNTSGDHRGGGHAGGERGGFGGWNNRGGWYGGRDERAGGNWSFGAQDYRQSDGATGGGRGYRFWAPASHNGGWNRGWRGGRGRY
jgi:hypothetical protein